MSFTEPSLWTVVAVVERSAGASASTAVRWAWSKQLLDEDDVAVAGGVTTAWLVAGVCAIADGDWRAVDNWAP